MSESPVRGECRRFQRRRPLLAFVSTSGQIRYMELGDEAISIGRSPRSDVPVRHPTVSLRHARVEPLADGRFRVVDCDSKNGTFVNDRSISEHVLRPGDKVRLGDTVFVYLEQPPTEGRAVDQPALLRHGASMTISVSPEEIEGELERSPSVPAKRRSDPVAQKRLAALFRLGYRLNRVQDEQTFFEVLVGVVAELFPTCRVGLFLDDESIPHAAVVPPGLPDFYKRPAPLESMVEARSCARAVLALPSPGCDAAPLGRQPTRASTSLLAPLIDEADAAAALVVVEGWPPLSDLDADDLRLLAMLSSQAGIMLRNVRLQANNLRALEHLERTRTELERLNRELEERVAERTRDIRRLAQIVTHATDAVIETDAEGRIRSWNEAASRLFGHEAERVAGKRLQELVCPHGHPAGLVPWRRFAETGRTNAVEAVWRTARGEPIDVEVSLFAIGDSEQPGTAAIVREVGERNRRHEDLLEASKLAALGALSAEFAHEFNNLLAGIVGNAELLGFEAQLSDDGRASLSAILEAGQRAREAIARFLDLAQGDKAKRERVDLGEVVDQAAALVERKLYMRNVRVKTRSDLVPIVYGNRGRLALMVACCLANAADAAEPGDTVSLRLGVEDERAVIAIEDRGCGMDGSTRARVFEPYFSTKKSQGGRGLGLSIAREVAKWHGGSIHIASEPGEGTTVTMRLPLAAARAAQAPAGEQQIAASSGQALHLEERKDAALADPVEQEEENGAGAKALRVVVVDDEDDVQAAMAAMVRRLGHEVAAFASARAALEHLETKEADVVLSDYAMPGQSGLELLEALEKRGGRLPVILVTGYAPPRLGEAHGARPAVLLRKPFTLRELEAALSAIVRRG